MFHEHCGKNVKLSKDAKTARCAGDPYGGDNVVFSSEKLTNGVPFLVKIEKTSSDGESLALGLTKSDPKKRPKLPGKAGYMPSSWVVWGSEKYINGKKEAKKWEGNLRVTPGNVVGVVWDDEEMWIIINGKSTRAFTNVSGPVWAITEVHWVEKMTVTPPGSKPRRLDSNTQLQQFGNQAEAAPVNAEDYSQSSEVNLGEPGPDDYLTKGTVPRNTSSTSCHSEKVCKQFLDSLGLSDHYFQPEYNCCFCIDCVRARGDELYYNRGVPPKLYGLPIGWFRFGLKVSAKAKAMKTFELWNVAFHGTVPSHIQKILEAEQLLMPGDYALDGASIKQPAGHFSADRKPDGFDVKQIFVSPSIAYAGHDAYAQPQKWTDPKTKEVHKMQVALQVRIKPDSFKFGGETVGLKGRKIDARFDNKELEWSTKLRGATSLTGILVKRI